MALKPALALAFSLMVMAAQAQFDYLQLTKRGRFVKSFGVGSFVEARLKDGSGFTGYIERVWKDSLLIKPFQLVQMATQFGTPIMDTIFRNRIRIHYQQIEALPLLKARRKLNLETALVYGGLGYTMVNVANPLLNGESLTADGNLRRIGIGAGLLGTGLLIGLLKPTETLLGGQWKLEYVPMSQGASGQ